ncbi:MAG: HNH endonuclease signature motif containing protein [Polaromonas sp.]
MSSLQHLRIKMYKTVARQLHGVVPCWVCGEHVTPEAATLEHIQALSDGGNSHAENLAISHEVCNGQRHAAGRVPASATAPGQVQRRQVANLDRILPAAATLAGAG